ncbi:MAG: ribosome biogenesis GTPase Der [Synergistaceae bacterium]|nr:ribosome biogenesis GTPase Der [Synergistaceae bacterium]
MAGIIAIIGRPNAGKSSLFNRLTGKRDAIVDDMPGVTRDRLYGEFEYRGRNYYVIDTGGIFGEDTAFSQGIRMHVDEAVKECDAVIFLIDGQEGVTGSDEEIAEFLRRGGIEDKPVIVAVNKLDDPKHDDLMNDAYVLGFEHVVGISAMHKRGIDDLVELIADLLPEGVDGEESDDAGEEIRLVIAGKPNVGKSSLLNKITGAERSLVSPVAGTTRDPVDMAVEIDGQKFRLIDTAGLRRRAKFGRGASRSDGDLEYYSFVRTLAAVDRADIALLLMDANEPCTDQDKKIAAHVARKGKGIVIVLNKWDLVSGEKKADELMKKVREDMPFVGYAPVVFASALSGRGLQKIVQAVLTVNENRQKRIPTNILNRLMRDVLSFDRLPSDRKGRSLKVYYCSQAESEPPTFIFFVNSPELVNTGFENHVKNKLRELEDFTGTPIRTFWRGKDKDSNG